MKQKNILIMLILAFIVVVAWIGLNVYHQAKTSTINDTTNIQIQPIAPNFDDSEIQQLQDRKSVAPLYQAAPTTTPVTPSSQPTSNSLPLISPTSASPNTTPLPSGGATSP